jgi:gliding motility-associated-like protein
MQLLAKLPVIHAASVASHTCTATNATAKNKQHMCIPRQYFFLLLLVYFMVSGPLQASPYKPQMAADSISYTSTCTGQAVSFSATVFAKANFPDTVIWNFGDTASGAFNISDDRTIFQPTHVYNTPGIYTVTLHVVDDFAGVFNLSTLVHIVAPVAINFGPDITTCMGDTITLSVPSIPGATYLWNDVGKTDTSQLRVYDNGTYTVQINGCTVTDTIGVFFSRIPQLELGANHNMCTGEILELNAASQNASYEWQLNGLVLPETTANIVTVSPGGTYTVAVDVLGCGIYRDTVVITYSNPLAPSFSLGPDTLLCPQQIYTLNASPAGATNYNWSIGSTQSSISVSSAGTYWVFVNINSVCEVTDTVIVSYRGNKQLDLRDSTICVGETLVLDADFGTGSYHWSANPPLRPDQDITDQSTFYVYKPAVYTVVAQVGNCVYTDSCTITYNDSLHYQLAPLKDTTLCLGEPWRLYVSGNANTYTWQDGSTATSFDVNTAGTYFVIATNACTTDTSTLHINFRVCDCELLMPSAFTPNSDGLNDMFRPLHPCKMSEYRMSIFNRFGQMVFTSVNPLLGWDGRYLGKAPVTGTYVWMATYINTDTNTRKNRTGTVVVIR